MNSANSHQKLNPRMWTGVPRVAYTFSGTTLISLITWHKCHLPRKTPPPQKDPPFPSSPAHSLFFSAQFFAACLFLVCPSLSVHLAIPSTAADSHRGSLTRWVLLPSCFTGEETGAERGQENVPRPGGGQERNAGYPAQVCPEPEPQRGARRLRQDSGSPQGALHPGAAEASSPPVSRHKPGAQGVAGRRRAWGPSAGTARQLHPSVVGLPRALPGDDFRRGCSTWGLCQAARRGGAGNGVLTAPQEESGSVSARGRQNPLPSSKAAPAQWSWKRNACAIVLRGTPRRCSAWPGRHVPSSTPAVGATQVTLAGIWFPVACPLPGLAEKDSRPMLEPH